MLKRHDPISERQVGPRPGSQVGLALDRRKAVQEAMQRLPGASVDEIIRHLAEQRVDVSATLVFQEYLRR